ncbi:SRPBCC family protein [Nocardia transvalensis]|uniref:SRPBCC family protein n=1 Tax=Nocardia transvalensis TaxID=37333 RepID=UPI001892EA04|nr:SRPBCC family protein [Nocardia transvalensis]MBF6329811.1 SRPBCC family protein [Nocardia transvalensis]
MIDINRQIEAVRREVGVRRLESGEEGRVLTLRQTYTTDIDNLWDACTNPERLAKWYESVSGDLRPNGRYRLESNTTGTIRRCEPPRNLAVTWEYEGDVSWVELRLSVEAEDRTALELEHLMPVNEHWEQYGPAAGGVGWDRSLLGLAAYTAGQPIEPDSSWDTSEAGVQFVTLSAGKWCEVDIAAGADPEKARAKAERAKSFYTASASS